MPPIHETNHVQFLCSSTELHKYVELHKLINTLVRNAKRAQMKYCLAFSHEEVCDEKIRR